MLAINAELALQLVRILQAKVADCSVKSRLYYLYPIAFLEKEAVEDRLTPKLHAEVGRLYKKILAATAFRPANKKTGIIEFREENTGSTVTEDVCKPTKLYLPSLRKGVAVLNGGGHGAMFHLAMVTYYHLTTASEFADEIADENTEGYVIKDIEASRRVFVYKDREQGKRYKDQKEIPKIDEKDKPLHMTLRYVNIVLKEENNVGDSELTTPEVWVELKAYKANVKDRYKTQAEGMNAWQLHPADSENKSQCRNSVLNKQFAHDRMASTHGARSIKGNDEKKGTYLSIPVNGTKWWYQAFKTEVKDKSRKTIRTDQSPKLGEYIKAGHIRGGLTAAP